METDSRNSPLGKRAPIKSVVEQHASEGHRVRDLPENHATLVGNRNLNDSETRYEEQQQQVIHSGGKLLWMRQQESPRHHVEDEVTESSEYSRPESLPSELSTQSHPSGSTNEELSLSPMGMTVSSQEECPIEDDTFYDDRSLERRLHKVLDQQLPPPTVMAEASFPRQEKSPSPATVSHANRVRVIKGSTRRSIQTGMEKQQHDAHRTMYPSHTVPTKQQVLASTSRLEEEVSRLTQVVRELTETNKRLLEENASLSTERQSVEGYKDEEFSTSQFLNLSQQLEQAQTELLKEREFSLSQHQNDSFDHILAMEEQCQAARAEIDTLTREKQAAQTQLDRILSEKANMEETIDSLHTKVETLQKENFNAVERVQALTDAYQSSLDHLEKAQHTNQEAQGRLSQIRKEKESLQSTVESLQKELRAAHEEVGVLRNNEKKTVQALESAKNTTAEISIQTEPSVLQTRSVNCQTETNFAKRPGNLFELSRPGDRLERIRDSAERASLVKHNQEEISKLVARREAETTSIKAAFDLEKEQLQQREVELESKNKKLKETCESRVANLERRMQELKEGADLKEKMASESVELAMAQVLAHRTQEEQEARKRQAAERHLEEMRARYEEDRKSVDARHETEVQLLQDGWEKEREKLIVEVQQECNNVFDRTKNSRRSSPNCVSDAFEFFPERISAYEPSETSDSVSPESQGVRTSPARSDNYGGSLSIADLNKSLLETEAMVQSFLKDPKNQ